jgi:glycosyltransferase involved in cell wall biosynthesis
VNFSIITPSFRNSNWLKLCIASVADQQGVTVEHLVQDSCSDDGTQDWLPHDTRVKAYIEKDKGMYDAVNRGWKRAQGAIVAYLNCDEQYLPGALKAVHDFFEQNPNVDVIFANTIVVDPAGNYLCHRQSLLPRYSHLWARFSNLTSGIFLRRKALEEHALFFDTQWRDLGDVYWVMDMAKRNIRMAVFNHLTSVFYITGDNMNLKPNAVRERQIKEENTPLWIKKLRPVFIIIHRLRLIKSGTFFQSPFEFSLYTPASPGKRVTQKVTKPTALWPDRRE